MSGSPPSGWVTTELRDIAEVRLGRQRSPDNVKGDHQRPYIRAANVTWDGLALDDVKEMNFEPHEFSIYELKHGDVVLAEASGSANEVGKPAIWRDEIPGCCFQNTLIRVRARSADPEYLRWHFLLNARAGHFAVAGRGVGINHLGADRMNKWPTLLPPRREQRRIVAKLEELTARSRRAKEALDAVPPLLAQLRQSILAAALRGDLTADWRAKNPNVEPADNLITRIRAERRSRWEATELARLTAKGKRPNDSRWKDRYEEPERLDASRLSGLPRGWAWASWREVGMSQNGRPFPSSEYQPSGVRLLRPGNLHVSGAVQWTSENTRCLPEQFAKRNPDLLVGPTEIVMNLTAQSLKDQFLGRVCLSGPEERSLLNQRLARLTPILLSPRFVMWMFKSPLVRSYIDGLNSGSLIQHMFTSQVEEFALPIPPLAEQDEILSRLDVALERVEAVAVQVEQAVCWQSDLDTSILAKAFRGELVPQDPNDEPASVLLERIRADRTSAESSGAKHRRWSRKVGTVAEALDRGDDDGDDPPQPAARPEPAHHAAKDLSEVDPEILHAAVFAALWTHGPLEKDDAVRRVAEHLRQAGYVEFQRLRADGPLYGQILAAIESAVKTGRLDRPKRGHVRACKADAAAYTADDWRHALVASLGAEPADRDDAIRAAAEWARDNLGLEFARLRSDGHIAEGLRSAINSAIRRGEVTRHNATHISRAPSNGHDAAGGQLSLTLAAPRAGARRGDGARRARGRHP